MRFAPPGCMTNEPRTASAVSISEIAERDRLRDLLDRLTYTRTEPQREMLLAEVRGEIQQIRKLADF